MTPTEAVATINKAMASKKYRDPGQEAAMWFAALELALPVLEEAALYEVSEMVLEQAAEQALVAIAKKLEGR